MLYLCVIVKIVFRGKREAVIFIVKDEILLNKVICYYKEF